MSIPLRLILPLYAEASSDCSLKGRIFGQQKDPVPLRNSSSHRRHGFGYTSSKNASSSSCSQSWLCGCTKGDQGTSCWKNEVENGAQMFGSDDEITTKIPTQLQSIVEGPGTLMVSEKKPIPDLDYLQELLAIQQQGPRAIGFFGTRNMGFMHQQLIEVLSYAMVITKNHIYTSGASGTNAAVIRGALRAEKPELLTVILPQSLKMQPPESQELLAKVQNVIEKPHNDHLPLVEASRKQEIISVTAKVDDEKFDQMGFYSLEINISAEVYVY